MTSAVYVLSDATGRVLYVGVTNDVERRLTEHRNKPWWNEVATTAIHHCESRARGLALEAELIQRLAPRHNQQHNAPEAVMAIDLPELMSPEEMAAAYKHFDGQAQADLSLAEKVRARCIETHGVDIAQQAVTA